MELTTAATPATVPDAQRLDPAAFYAAMRRHRPVAHEPATDGWHLYRYDDCLAVLSDPATFSSQRSLNPRNAGPPQVPSLLTTDPPRHRRLRDLVSRAFTPRTVAGLEGRMVEITRSLLDRVVGPRSAGEMDVVADLATPLPVIVIAELLGIPPEDRDRFKRWSDAIAAATEGGDPDAEPAVADLPPALTLEMGGYLAGILAQRRAAPRDDLISGLVGAEIDGQRLTELELIAFCILLLVAGNITTTNLIANAVRTLLAHPPAWDALRATPDRLPMAIEEVLRYESPVRLVARVTTRDATVGGETIPAGRRVTAWIGAANRDEARFPAAERFDPARQPNPHLAFGHGIHYCLGAPLARLEARVALEALLARLEGPEVAGGAPLQPVRGFFLHGVARLPLRFTPRAG